MTITEVYGTGLACQDCIMLIANGETPHDWTDDETMSWFESIRENMVGTLWVGMGHDHDSPDAGCFHASEPCEDDCDCERDDFSRMQCDHCGTTLAGSRHAITWTVPVHVESKGA